MNNSIENPSAKPIVAAFDFDGTITFQDTLRYFLLYYAGVLKGVVKLACLLPVFIRFIVGKATRQETKETVLTYFFQGISIEALREKGEEFAKKILPNHIKKKAWERIDWHLNQGHRCILVSASLDVYLLPWSKKAGFTDLISSSLETTSSGLVTGKLKGLNCWGAEKTRRLDNLLGKKENYILYAYGDSLGDKEMLNMADYPYFKTIP